MMYHDLSCVQDCFVEKLTRNSGTARVNFPRQNYNKWNAYIGQAYLWLCSESPVHDCTISVHSDNNIAGDFKSTDD